MSNLSFSACAFQVMYCKHWWEISNLGTMNWKLNRFCVKLKLQPHCDGLSSLGNFQVCGSCNFTQRKKKRKRMATNGFFWGVVKQALNNLVQTPTRKNVTGEWVKAEGKEKLWNHPLNYLLTLFLTNYVIAVTSRATLTQMWPLVRTRAFTVEILGRSPSFGWDCCSLRTKADASK